MCKDDKIHDEVGQLSGKTIKRIEHDHDTVEIVTADGLLVHFTGVDEVLITQIENWRGGSGV